MCNVTRAAAYCFSYSIVLYVIFEILEAPFCKLSWQETLSFFKTGNETKLLLSNYCVNLPSPAPVKNTLDIHLHFSLQETQASIFSHPVSFRLESVTPALLRSSLLISSLLFSPLSPPLIPIGQTYPPLPSLQAPSTGKKEPPSTNILPWPPLPSERASIPHRSTCMPHSYLIYALKVRITSLGYVKPLSSSLLFSFLELKLQFTIVAENGERNHIRRAGGRGGALWVE